MEFLLEGLKRQKAFFLFIYETGYVFYAADVPVLEEHWLFIYFYKLIIPYNLV